MNDVLSRHRPLALLATVIFVQVLLLAFQIKREHDVRLVRYWAVQLLTPVERVGTWSFSKVSGAWSGYVGLRDTRAENERLKRELEKLSMRNRELESKAAEAQRLSLLLNFRELHPEAPMLAAQVIGASADPTSHTLFINRGERDHLRRNLAVITPDGVVGKIVEVFPSASQVLLINDKDSGVGALFADTRTHGVVKGNGDPEPRMEYVENGEKVRPGEAVLTSGEDRIFPKGFPIGTVESAAAGNPFQVIHIQSAARLDRLEEVLVLLTQQELSPKKGEEGPLATPPHQIFQPPAASQKNSSAGSGAATAPKKVKPPVKPAPQSAAPSDVPVPGNAPAAAPQASAPPQ
ncbi:MAG: rod shape-determining protein MreC [Candidatus Acidiferrales bacterium]